MMTVFVNKMSYDSMKFVVPAYCFETKSLIERIDGLIRTEKIDSGEVRYQGYFHGLKVRINSSGLEIRGSLNRLFANNNLRLTTYNGMANAIELIADELKIQSGIIRAARVMKLEFGIDIDLEHEPKCYFPSLGESSTYIRSSFTEDTLYYTNTNQKKSFYDKIKCAKDKGVKIPHSLVNRHIMRYEYKIKSAELKREGRKIGLGYVSLEDLSNRKLYESLLERWLKGYYLIDKVHTIKPNFGKIEVIKDAVNVLAAKGIETLGGVGIVYHQISEAKKGKSGWRKENGSRLKKKLKEVSMMECAIEPNQHVNELTKKIEEAAAEALR